MTKTRIIPGGGFTVAGSLANRLVIALVGAVLVLGGCRGPGRKPLPICPGKGSASEALFALRLRSENVSPVRASGSCRVEYHVQGKDKLEKESFPVKLWLHPPTDIYMQGDIAFDARGLVLGANKDEFWLTIRPKKVSSYWWGAWAYNDNAHNLMLSPKVILEAMGIAAAEVDANDKGDWSLSNEGPFDILTRRNDAGRIVKKIYVCSCDYLVRKIEYYNELGQVEVIAELDEYKEIVEGFSTPSSIKVTTQTGAARGDSAGIVLKSVREWTKIKDKQLEYLFTRPKSDKFKYVYEVINGQWVERSSGGR